MENNYRPSSPISNRYWLMLKDLSDNVKIELIALLSNSVAHKAPVRHDSDWATRFAGAWIDNRSPEDIIDDIYSSRTTNSRDLEL